MPFRANVQSTMEARQTLQRLKLEAGAEGMGGAWRVVPLQMDEYDAAFQDVVPVFYEGGGGEPSFYVNLPLITPESMGLSVWLKYAPPNSDPGQQRGRVAARAATGNDIEGFVTVATSFRKWLTAVRFMSDGYDTWWIIEDYFYDVPV